MAVALRHGEQPFPSLVLRKKIKIASAKSCRNMGKAQTTSVYHRLTLPLIVFLPGRWLLPKIQKVQNNSATSLKIVNKMVFYCSNNLKAEKCVATCLFFPRLEPLLLVVY